MGATMKTRAFNDIFKHCLLGAEIQGYSGLYIGIESDPEFAVTLVTPSQPILQSLAERKYGI